MKKALLIFSIIGLLNLPFVGRTQTVSHLTERTFNGASGSPVVVYPNPVTDFVEVKVEDAYKDETKSILIYDLLGRVVMRTSFTTGSARLFVNNLPTGMYIMKIELPDGVNVITPFVKPNSPAGTN
jgi:hypothetical protein